MPLPTFTAKTDGVDIVHAVDVNELQNEVAPTAAAALAVRYSTTATSTAITLTDASMPVQSVLSTANGTIALPAVSTANHGFYVVNRSTANTITVNNSAAAFVAYIRPNSAGILFPDSTAGWYGVSMPKLSTSTSPVSALLEDGTFHDLSALYAPKIASPEVIGGVNAFDVFCNLAVISSTHADGVLMFGSIKSTIPTVTFASSSLFKVQDASGTGLVVTSITASVITKGRCEIDVFVSTGLVAGNASLLYANNSTLATITVTG